MCMSMRFIIYEVNAQFYFLLFYASYVQRVSYLFIFFLTYPPALLLKVLYRRYSQ